MSSKTQKGSCDTGIEDLKSIGCWKFSFKIYSNWKHVFQL